MSQAREPPLRLPLPPQLGYTLQSKDIISDKTALWQWTQGAFSGYVEAMLSCSAPEPLCLPCSLLQGLVLSLLLTPLHPTACQSPLQAVLLLSRHMRKLGSEARFRH